MPTTVLIADDSLFARMVMKEALKEVVPEAEVLEAKSGTETLDLFNSKQAEIDAYLLDVNMGDPDGLTVAKQMIESGIGANNIALITGNKSQELITSSEDIGVVYINKIIHPSDKPRFLDELKAFLAPHSEEVNK